MSELERSPTSHTYMTDGENERRKIIVGSRPRIIQFSFPFMLSTSSLSLSSCRVMKIPNYKTSKSLQTLHWDSLPKSGGTPMM